MASCRSQASHLTPVMGVGISVLTNGAVDVGVGLFLRRAHPFSASYLHLLTISADV